MNNQQLDEIFEQLVRENTNLDLSTLLNDLQDSIDLLSDLFFNMGDAKIQLENYQEFFETQLVRFIYISSSMIKLAGRTPIRNFRKKDEILNFDINSLYILARAQLESYLMFYYSHIDIATKDEGEFKHDLYILSGLVKRQEYYPAGIEHKMRKEFELKQIEELVEKIRCNNYFKSLDPKVANKLLADKPSRTMGWEKLILKSRLGKKIFPTIYKLYCNYAHAEAISAIQFKAFVGNTFMLKGAVCQVIDNATILTSMLIKDLTQKFRILDICYNSKPQTLTINIDLKDRIGENS